MSDCREIQITIPGPEADRQAAITELANALAALPTTGFAEVWVDHDPFPALCALLNGDKGWLMWIRYDGDAGFSSRNPAYAGPSGAQVEYMLGNGQIDRYPPACAYPRGHVCAALQSFAHTRRVPGVSWFNDSEDGSASPHETGTQG